ncbi:MAG: molybdopterin molybdotransferase MoeA, partial [Acidobacteriota bacterium]
LQVGPRLALLVTGDELAPPGHPLAAGQLYDSNGPMLGALAAEAHLEVEAAHRVGDEAAALRQALAELASRCDLLVTSGGVSEGERDLLPSLLAELGAELAFHKVAMQPAKPLLVARLHGTWVVGLPGNPVSALVGWRLFARPLAEALAGDRHAFAEHPLPATLVAPLASPAKRLLFRPARLEWTGVRWEVEVIPWQGSHDLVAAASANALARLERGQGAAAGEVIAAYPLPWPEWNTGTPDLDG